MTVLAVIPTYLRSTQDLAVAQVAIGTLRATTDLDDVELLVVDDGSPDSNLRQALGDVVAAAGGHLIAKDHNEGFSRTVNVGLTAALAEGVDAVLVNADVQFHEAGWLGRMLARTSEDGEPAAVVGARLLYPAGLIQHAGIFFSLLHRTFGHIYQYAPPDLPEAQKARTCPVTGALQLIRHSALAEVGVYDERFRMGFEDVDYCVRVFEAGGTCVYEPTVCAYHHESLFRGRGDEKVLRWQDESWAYFVHKYRETNFARWVPSLI